MSRIHDVKQEIEHINLAIHENMKKVDELVMIMTKLENKKHDLEIELIELEKKED